MQCYPTPVHRAGTSNGRRKGRTHYDLAGIREWFFERGALADLFVTVEASRPMPPKMKGTIANFNRGVSCGWEWMLVGLGVSYQLVRPVDWSRAMHAGTPSGDTKQRSIMAAQRLFPGVDLRRTPRCLKVDDGIATSADRRHRLHRSTI